VIVSLCRLSVLFSAHFLHLVHLRFLHRENSGGKPFPLWLSKTNPRKFDHAKPLRKWREGWPPSYHHMLRDLREKWPEGRGVQEFVRVLHLHQDYPASLIQQAIEQALSYGCAHLDGVLHCLHQLIDPQETPSKLDLSDRPELSSVGNQPIDLSRYEQLLKQSW